MNWRVDKPAGSSRKDAVPSDSVAALARALEALEEEFSRLSLALEDHPPKAVPALLDHFENAATDRMGELGEIRAAAAILGDSQATFEQRLSCLASVQEKINLLGSKHRQELAVYDRLQGLQRLGRERGGEWPEWARAVKLAVESCAAPLDDVQCALLACWRELSARGGLVFVGQPVVLPEVTFTLGKEQTRTHP